MRTTTKSRLSAAATVVAATFCVGAAASAETTLRFATLAPEGTPWFAMADTWSKNVAEASGGDIKIEVFGGGQLGSEEETYGQVARGRIDAGLFSAAVMAENNPSLALFTAPFLFDDTKSAHCVVDAMRDDIEGILNSGQMQMVGLAEMGVVHIYAQEDLSDVAAAEDYRIRVAPQPMSRVLWSAVGANGTELPYADTPPALQTGLVRGGESSPISYVAFGINKVAPHLMLTGHQNQIGAILMSQKAWDGLSAEQQKILSDQMPGVDTIRAGVAQMEGAMVGMHSQNGGFAHELTAEQMGAWRAAVEPFYPEFVEGLGSDAAALWPRILEARTACVE